MTIGPFFLRPLTDAFAGLFAYVTAFRQTLGSRQPPYEEVRGEILRLLKTTEAIVARGECTPKEYEQARYAVCAWIDESILSSAWTFKGKWWPERLERLYYQSADAGESFFTRLKSLEAPDQGVREIYTLCLALGFKGRYCAPDDGETLKQIKERNLKLLFNSTEESPTIATLEKNILFPEAYSSNSTPASKRSYGRSLGWTALIVTPVVLLITLFLIYHFTLYHIGDTIQKAVQS